MTTVRVTWHSDSCVCQRCLIADASIESLTKQDCQIRPVGLTYGPQINGDGLSELHACDS